MPHVIGKLCLQCAGRPLAALAALLGMNEQILVSVGGACFLTNTQHGCRHMLALLCAVSKAPADGRLSLGGLSWAPNARGKGWLGLCCC